MFDHFLRTLTRRDSSLPRSSLDRLLEAFEPPDLVTAGSDIVTQGSRPNRSTLLLQGWGGRYGTLADGRRQTLALHIAGDFVDLHSYPLKVMDHSVGALTDCTTVSIPHERLRALTDSDPHLARVLWLMTLIDSAILRKWLMGAGQQTALEHAAHLYCELYKRLEIAGIAKADYRFGLPLSQAEFGDALGITPVHVSRTLGELRVRNLFEWRRGQAQILDWPGLSRLAEFDPVYLSIVDEPR